jgi:hypothetical protein
VKTALTQLLPVRGFIAHGAFLREEERAQVEGWLDDVPNLRGYIFYGETDNPEFRVYNEELMRKMEARGMPCNYELMPGIGHTFPADFPARLRAALEFLTA